MFWTEILQFLEEGKDRLEQLKVQYVNIGAEKCKESIWMARAAPAPAQEEVISPINSTFECKYLHS